MASSDVKTIYRNWEDSLSRKLYIQSGISDDRVAASIQMYIEEKRDSDVRNDTILLCKAIMLRYR